ncbi:MAG: pilus assembly protein PilM [Candidatus Omnitrophota bacterium]
MDILNMFAKKDLAGIYFSARGLVITQQKAGRVKTLLCLPYPGVEGETSGAPSAEIFEIFKNREMEMIAFLQKALRDSKIDTQQIVVSLPPKDLIIRFFEMPNIPTSELVAGINFEMKKYIPFKIEELAFDFQYRIRQRANIIEVILCGMRQDPLDRYVNLFKQLNLTAVAFEPGLFSLFRLLVIKNKVSSQRSYVILEYDYPEANVLIVERGFPYFTRDIKLSAGWTGEPSAEEMENILFRLVNEVRVSLDYYRRQFLKKEIDEMLIVSGRSTQHWADQFNKELGVKVSFSDLGDLLKSKDVRQDMLSDTSKALGAALRVERPFLITLNLSKVKVKGIEGPLQILVATFHDWLRIGMSSLKESKATLVKGFILAAAIMVVGYGYGFSKVFPLEKESRTVTVNQPPLLPEVDLTSLESIKASEAVFMAKERDFTQILKSLPVLYKKLEIFPRLMPQGIWLSNMDFSSVSGSWRLVCNSYWQDEKTMADNINVFVSNLKSSEEFQNIASSIDVTSVRQVQSQGLTYIQFDVTGGDKASTAFVGGMIG